MKAALFGTLILSSVLMAGCKVGSSATGTPAGSATLDPAAPGASQPATYTEFLKIDNDSTCPDQIVKRMYFDPASGQGFVTEIDCASAAAGAQTPIDPQLLHYHRRFTRTLVYQGDIFIAQAHLKPGYRPVIYCQLEKDETALSYLFMSFMIEDLEAWEDPLVDGSCSVRRAYVDPYDGYHYSGAGGTSCGLMAYTDDGSTIHFNREGLDVTVYTQDGTHIDGFKGQISVPTSGGDVLVRTRCFVDSTHGQI